MLVLRRKKNESILIGNDIRITILECASDGIRIAIDAPKQISIIREELSQAEMANKNAISPASSSVRSFQAAMAKHAQSQNPDVSTSSDLASSAPSAESE